MLVPRGHPEVERGLGAVLKGSLRPATESILRAVALLVLLLTAVQSVIVPRGLYADGAYNLWRVLNSENFVVIGPARTFAILLNQSPVVLALKLGVRDLDVLIGFYSFGVAAVPVLIWLLALVIQLRGRMFWPLVVIYATTFLNSGFIAIGEYTYAFALVALAVAVLTARRAVRGWSAVALVFASVALILCYEGVIFLEVPLIALVAVRLWRRCWIADGVAPASERVSLWVALISAFLAAGAAGASLLIRSFDSADTNLRGAMDYSFALQFNRQWRVSALVAAFLLLTALISRPRNALVARTIVAVAATGLFMGSLWSPAWLHYESRSLTIYTFLGLLSISLAALIRENRRVGPGILDRDAASTAPSAVALGAASCVLLLSMSMAFFSLTQGYAAWLKDLTNVVVTNRGAVDIATTDLHVGDRAQFSWGWTNPYLSALLQTDDGQGSVLSQSETLEKFTPISPASSADFFKRYHRAGTLH